MGNHRQAACGRNPRQRIFQARPIVFHIRRLAITQIFFKRLLHVFHMPRLHQITRQMRTPHAVGIAGQGQSAIIRARDAFFLQLFRHQLQTRDAAAAQSVQCGL